MQENATIQEKQNFLRGEIIDAGIDPESFMAYMGTVKDEGQQINLDNWTLPELKSVVSEFKKSLQEEIKREEKQISAMQKSKEMMTHKIMENLVKKERVYYDQNDLWDYQIHNVQECKKIPRLFEFKSPPEIDYKSWDIKKSGGFIFGFGAKNELEISLITNFTSVTVTRKSDDVDWLRAALSSKFTGSYIPPLEETRYIEPEDKGGTMRRVKQVIMFLNSLTSYDYLIQNKYFYTFINETDAKKFANFRSKMTGARLTADIGSIENLQGKFTVEISQRVLNFVKDSSAFASQAEQIYTSIETNIRKVLGDMENLTKHTHYIANDFAKLQDRYSKMAEKCQVSDVPENQNMSNIFIYLNNMFTTIGNQSKKNMVMLKELSEDFIKYLHAEWTEFLLHHKKYNYELNNYLTIKYNLLKKKERALGDVNKWELDEREQFRMSRINPAKMDKEEAYEIMFPKDNRIEEETRIWQAYINEMYEDSYKMLLIEQEHLYLKNFGKYCFKAQKLSEEQVEVYKRFREVFEEEKRAPEKMKQQ